MRKARRASRPRRTSGLARHPKADDLKRIRGIGLAMEKRLRRAGIRTFARLAALSPAEVAAALPGLAADRVARQGWICQARGLASHRATFVVEFQLSEEGEARIVVRARHVQCEAEEHWEGLEPGRLLDFLSHHASLRGLETVRPRSLRPLERKQSRNGRKKPTPLVRRAPQVAPVAPPRAETVAKAADAVPAAPPTAAPLREPEAPIAMPVPAPAVAESAQGPSIAVGLASLVLAPAALPTARPTCPSVPALSRNHGGAPHVTGIEAASGPSAAPSSVLPHGRAFEVRVQVDLTGMVAPLGECLNYRVEVHAKGLGRALSHLLGQAAGVIPSADRLTLAVAAAALPPGMYHLRATVMLSPSSAPLGPAPGPIASVEGGLIQIF